MTNQTVFSGLKIIEIGSFVSAAYCTKLFADLGAEVIKVEESGLGDEARSYGPFPGDLPHPELSGLFFYLNCNKMGITLNLRNATGREILLELIRRCDILVDNNPPSLMNELGLTYDILGQVNPKLIMTSITAFGQSGPYRDHKAYAINCAAAGGESVCIGEPAREPLTPPLSLGHYQAAGMAASATIIALLARKRDGKGQHIDVSEAELWAKVHTSLMVHNFVFEGRKRARSGHRTPGFYPYTILPCKDGYMSLIAVLGSQWNNFLEIVGGGKVPDWYDKSKFADRWMNSLKHADELDALLAPWLTSHTRKDIFSQCQDKRVPFAPVRTIGEVVEAPDLKEREYFVEYDHPCVGKTKLPGAPYKFHHILTEAKSPAPLLGQHNKDIYCGRLGYSKQRLKELEEAGII